MVLNVQTENDSYDIVLERGALSRLDRLLDTDRRCLVVTDSGVPERYVQTVLAQCPRAGLLTLPQGENNKNLSSLTAILSRLLDEDFHREDALVALGGGMVGDVTGFAASVYLRGIAHYMIPATLLAQVDSSIGGKTAIDFGGVKNPVGSFWQPKGVLIDPDVLDSLPARQLHAGLAEAIKTAVIGDPELFRLLGSAADLRAVLPQVIERSLAVKRRIVEDDPKEKETRRLLNFGHTLGHAIEAAAGGTLLHGECVAIGMLPLCRPSVRWRLETLLRQYDLPTQISLNPEELLRLVLKDKKAFSGGVRVIRAEAIGRCEECVIPPEELKDLIRTWFSAPSEGLFGR